MLITGAGLIAPSTALQPPIRPGMERRERACGSESGKLPRLSAGTKGGEYRVTRSFSSQLYRAARLSNNLRAMSRGPGAYAKRVVRRKTYRKTMGATRWFLRGFGLSR